MTHKFVSLDKTGICPIQVGNAADSFCELRDNSADNIAQYNHVLSELTAHYWVWKNHDTDVVGFCHYRRFLLPENLIDWLNEYAQKPYANLPPGGVGNYASGYVINASELLEKLKTINYIDLLSSALESTDVLLPAPNKLPEGSFLKQYGNAHTLEPFFTMLAVIARKDNNLAKKAHRFFTTHPHAYWNNLYITRRECFEEFCEFQFEVLRPMLAQQRTFNDPYQQRYGAFLSERLFNFWLWHRNLSVKHLPWCMTETMEAGADPHQRQIQKKNRIIQSST